jgi:hypothetical protein
MSGFRSVLVLCSVLVLTVAVGTAEAGGGNSANAKLCQKGGWASSGLQTASGESIAFGNQDACISYGAKTGPLFSPTLTADPTHVVEDEGSTLTATGFHPSSSGTLTDHVLGGSGGTVTFPVAITASGGLPAGVGTVFTAGACAAGVYGAEFTLADEFGVHASTTVYLDCP